MDEQHWNEERQQFGHLLESFVLQQIMAMASCMARPPRFFHFRDRDKTEVDIVIESRHKVWGIEIKAASSVRLSDAKGLLRLANIAADDFQAGVVFYDGEATVRLSKLPDVLAVPISKLWKL